jgi:hypothetical protein
VIEKAFLPMWPRRRDRLGQTAAQHSHPTRKYEIRSPLDEQVNVIRHDDIATHRDIPSFGLLGEVDKAGVHCGRRQSPRPLMRIESYEKDGLRIANTIKSRRTIRHCSGGWGGHET